MSDQKGKTLTLTRVFDAPVSLVWKMWTDPQEVAKWWGPDHFTSHDNKIDLRVGGKYIFVMVTPDGHDSYSGGTYKEIVPMKKIVVTDSFTDKDGNVVSPKTYGMPDSFPETSEITITFDEKDGKTTMNIVYTDITGIEGKMLEDMTAGWNQSLNKMGIALDGVK